MAELDNKRWQQIRQIRERRQKLAAARASQAAADWRTRQGEAQRQDDDAACAEAGHVLRALCL